MLYLSQVLGRPILDLDGERVAALKDVIVRLGEEDRPPLYNLAAWITTIIVSLLSILVILSTLFPKLFSTFS